jgi:RNA polymerase sigma factor (sigma-70 family)
MSPRPTSLETPAGAAPGSEENAPSAWNDNRLVQECVRGNEEAWSALIDKYKRLIYSIPIKYNLSPDQAADIFQSVCVELLSELPKLREPKALPKWIMQVTAHKCLRQKRHDQRMETGEEAEAAFDASVIPPVAESVLREAQEEHSLRDAIDLIPPRCRRLVAMLFFEEPPRAYKEVAESLGIATGSVGFIRQRCLDRLRKRLEETGFR